MQTKFYLAKENSCLLGGKTSRLEAKGNLTSLTTRLSYMHSCIHQLSELVLLKQVNTRFKITFQLGIYIDQGPTLHTEPAANHHHLVLISPHSNIPRCHIHQFLMNLQLLGYFVQHKKTQIGIWTRSVEQTTEWMINVHILLQLAGTRLATQALTSHLKKLLLTCFLVQGSNVPLVILKTIHTGVRGLQS